VGRLGCRGISSFRWKAHDAIEATTAVGLNQLADPRPEGVGVMPIVELATGVVSEPKLMLPPVG
jgi:hypothetical protein